MYLHDLLFRFKHGNNSENDIVIIIRIWDEDIRIWDVDMDYRNMVYEQEHMDMDADYWDVDMDYMRILDGR